ncbi:conserved hypothetical protein [Altererythrobacter sp. B11]|uniref:anti-phage-associated DUF499 domain-containing protein n=1 Tax=Altererythrobacter sp. B11 TaxID=2060312 RepID=UPI000DC73EB7|nr:anti-phage-associated DUF499 domain-containing protein [Altererythrobacter sp. B11]BBC70896.1 conserved hypothetical protein [Altererythrobacter sp. B11]
MLQTVLDTCTFKQDAIAFALTDQIEDLSDLAGHTHEDAEAFFDKTYVTEGMATLIRQGLQRLAGTNKQAIFELRQAMGGGKTHSMLALGYLAANPTVARTLDTKITEGFQPVEAKVVVVSGRNIPHDKYLWGSVAEQLGKAEEFAQFYAHGPRFPNEQDWIDLFGDEPVLILFDELPPYLDAAVSIPVGGGTLADVTSQALSNLFSAATKVPHLCVVLSTLVGQYRASADLTKIIDQVTAEARRQAKPITPVELGSDEIYAILRKRLLTEEPDSAVVDAVAEEYGKILSAAVTSKTLERSAEKIADEVQATYPFHPGLKTVVATFKDNENFRQTRGLMTLAALMIRSAQARKHNDVYLLGPQHIDLADRETRDVINNIYNLDAAITQDIVDTGTSDAHAEQIDLDAQNDAASQAATLILMASLAEASDAVKGLLDTEVLAYLLAPHRSEAEFITGFDALKSISWYLHRRDNGAWFFSKNENLTKKIENTAKNAPAHKVDQDLARRLEEVFAPKLKTAYARVQPLPKVEDIETRGERVLIVLSPDAKLPPDTASKLFSDTTAKNNFAIVSGDGHSLASVEQKVRTAYAIEKVLKEEGVNSPNRPDLEERQAEAEIDVYTTIASTLNKIWYPAKDSSGEGLVATPLKLDGHRRSEGSGFDGEGAVIAALTATGASKLVQDVEGEFEKLRIRAEDMLWPGTEKTTRLADIQDRAISNVRWLWLPRGGLDELIRLAKARGVWRDTGNGWIEKGPFAKQKTRIAVADAGYDEGTGTATIHVSAQNAGRRPVIHWSNDPDVTKDSPVLDDTTVRTADMKRYFLAIDPDGEHETGDVHEWTNRLHLTHQPKPVGSGYEVTLTVKPTGTIRWNTDGTNAAEGSEYTGPIKLDGTEDVTIYAYAEAQGVTIKQDFRINRREGAGQKIDAARPAVIRRTMQANTNDKVFAATTQAKQSNVTFQSVVVIVGSGSQNVTTSFAADIEVDGAAIEEAAKFGRTQVKDDQADVKVTWKALNFQRAADIDAFASAIDEAVDPTEIEQQ